MGKKILVIDDDEQVRVTVGRTLERAGYQVSLADDGKVGLELFRKEPSDAVITDIYMPEQEGLQTIMELRKISPGLPIIAISGGSNKIPLDFLPIARKLGATEVMKKPFLMDELLNTVRRVLGLPKGGKQ